MKEGMVKSGRFDLRGTQPAIAGFAAAQEPWAQPYVRSIEGSFRRQEGSTFPSSLPGIQSYGCLSNTIITIIVVLCVCIPQCTEVYKKALRRLLLLLLLCVVCMCTCTFLIVHHVTVHVRSLQESTQEPVLSCCLHTSSGDQIQVSRLTWQIPHYLVVRGELETWVLRWRNLANIKLTEGSQFQKSICWLLPFMGKVWNKRTYKGKN